MKSSLTGLVMILALGSVGCTAAVGTSGPVSVPSDAQDQCREHCVGIGMSLGAVAIMANNVGCVCQPQSSGSGDESAAITAGMATIAMQEAENQRQQQQQQAQRR